MPFTNTHRNGWLCVSLLSLAALLMPTEPARAGDRTLFLQIEQIAHREPTRDVADRRTTILKYLREANSEQLRKRYERKLAALDARIERETGLLVRGVAQLLDEDDPSTPPEPFNAGLFLERKDRSMEEREVGDLISIRAWKDLAEAESLVTVRYYAVSKVAMVEKAPESWMGRPADLPAPWCDTPTTPDQMLRSVMRAIEARKPRDAGPGRICRHLHCSPRMDTPVGSCKAQLLWYSRSGEAVGPFDVQLDPVDGRTAFSCVNVTVKSDDEAGLSRLTVRVCDICPDCWSENEAGEDEDKGGSDHVCATCGCTCSSSGGDDDRGGGASEGRRIGGASRRGRGGGGSGRG